MVTPLAASIETVKFVSLEVSPVFFISGKPSFLHLALVRVRQISPLPFEAIKLISFALTNSDAITRSPSFSRFSSSIMMTIFPFLRESIISLVVLVIFEFL